MLDHLEGDNQIESAGREGQRDRRRLNPAEIDTIEFLGCVRDCFSGDIDAGNELRIEREFGGAIACTAARIEDAAISAETRGECVSGDVLVPKIDVYLARYDALPRKLSGHR